MGGHVRGRAENRKRRLYRLGGVQMLAVGSPLPLRGRGVGGRGPAAQDATAAI
ncbi:hypothetical protein D9X30_1733 [Cupriavidus sp. U2]|nr:hypothetical protein D9X30_1733 [Cupriavidus sp. U2]